ncbi:DUF4157 domain-containing protein [Streptomyces sp. NPDC001822]|uniref:eCIS core domain-containing protein n=1 Tax=Streptomyces sp. NPDC001822 TaxID=3364614 RepID=UPI0036A00FF2
MGPAMFLQLQQTAGNAALTRVLAAQRRAAGSEQEWELPGGGVQRSAVHQVLSRPGTPLTDAERAEMEARFDGADFSTVRKHDDALAARAAEEVDAHALTAGEHIVIGKGGRGKRTLAHELTHVLQQREGPVSGTDRGDGVKVSHASDPFEVEAENKSREVMAMPAPQADAVQRSADASAGEHGSCSHATAGSPEVQRSGRGGHDSRAYYEEGEEYERTDVSYYDEQYARNRPSRRVPSQNTVMGGSANDELRRAGVHPGGRTSHLHLAAAWAHGDAVNGTPQRRDNLAPGSDGTNLSHRRYEYANSGYQIPHTDVVGPVPSYQSARAARYASPADMHGIPITHAGLSNRVGNSSVYRDFDYAMMSPHEPLASERFGRRFDPLDPRAPAVREQQGDLLSQDEIRRQAMHASARQVMGYLPEGEVPEYDEWEQRRLRDRASRSPSASSHRSASPRDDDRDRYRRRR